MAIRKVVIKKMTWVDLMWRLIHRHSVAPTAPETGLWAECLIQAIINAIAHVEHAPGGSRHGKKRWGGFYPTELAGDFEFVTAKQHYMRECICEILGIEEDWYRRTAIRIVATYARRK